jgi:hypothetical protein
MRRSLLAGALLCAGCLSSGPKEPPSGVVDPERVSAEQLSIDWKKAQATQPSTPAANQPNPPMWQAPSPSTGKPAPAPAADDAAPSSDAGTSEMEWTGEHCTKLGAKFMELGQASGMPESMAAQTGQRFAADCMRDKVGEKLDRHEYDCVMAATSVLSIPACAR